MDTLKLLILCIVASIFAVILKESKKDYSPLVIIASSVIIMSILMVEISGIAENVNNMIDNIPLSPNILNIIIKSLGISIICEIASTLCKDMGENTMALKSELVGRVALVVLSIPLINELLSKIDWVLGI